MARNVNITVFVSNEAPTSLHPLPRGTIFGELLVGLVEVWMCAVDAGVKDGNLYSWSKGLSARFQKSLGPRIELIEPYIGSLDAA